MEVGILTLSDKKRWDSLFKQLPEIMQDPGFLCDWYGHFEKQGYGKAICFFAEENGKMAIYPFLKNNINKLGYKLKNDFFDIQGAPGYNGIASSTDDMGFLAQFHRHFTKWCIDNNIVAEFSRCNPVLENNKLFVMLHLTEINRNIISQLQTTEDHRAKYHRSTIKNIKKAIREGLKVEKYPFSNISKKRLYDFLHIYNETMHRNKANSEYTITEQFLLSLVSYLKNRAAIYFTIYDQKPVSTEIILAGKKTAYSYLGGTLSEYYPLRPNDILKDHIIKDLKENGFHYYCLGGGAKPNDGIYRYKKSFDMYGDKPFYILKRVHLPDIYNNIMDQWYENKNVLSLRKYSNRLLAYRYL